MKSSGFVALALLVAATARGAAPGTAAPPADPLTRIDRQVDLAGARSVRIVDPFGDVLVRDGGPGSTLRIHAVVQNLHPPQVLRITSERSGDELLVRVVPEGRRGPGGPPSDRADLAVHVPRGVSLTVETVDGRIESRGFAGSLDVSTVSGEIDLRGVAARLSARTDSGEVTAVLSNTPAALRRELESITGSLTVLLPAEADATVVAETSGDVTTDVSVEITRIFHAEPNKRVRAKVREGNGNVTLRSRRGNVRILQAIDFRDRPSAAPDNIDPD